MINIHIKHSFPYDSVSQGIRTVRPMNDTAGAHIDKRTKTNMIDVVVTDRTAKARTPRHSCTLMQINNYTYRTAYYNFRAQTPEFVYLTLRCYRACLPAV